MSDLVEKVAKEMHDFWGPYEEGSEWERTSGTVRGNTRATARAAIRAVLAHYAEAENVTVEMIMKLRTGLIDAKYDTKEKLIASYQAAIAAAMAAALKEMEG